MLTCLLVDIPSDHLAALGIGEPRAGQRHIGILYRARAGNPPRFLHLAWHLNLRDNDNLPTKYRCALLRDVPTLLHPTIVAQCKRSAEVDTLQGLPYGFGYKPTTVHRKSDGGALVIEGASGLTCATFVLAILQVANVQLVDLSTWMDREGDDSWKEAIIAQLAAAGASEEHMAAVRDNKHEVRVRPEDVAGAATEVLRPVSFEPAVQKGLQILRELRTP